MTDIRPAGEGNHPGAEKEHRIVAVVGIEAVLVEGTVGRNLVGRAEDNRNS
jgi:hypothetical protein